MKLLRSLIVLTLLRLVGKRRPATGEPPSRIVEKPEPAPRAELTAAWLLGLAAACGGAFVVAYAADGSTQLLGLALAAALALIGAALVVLAKRVLPNEELEDDYPQTDGRAVSDSAQIMRESGDAITRKRLLVGAGSAAGCALGAAAIVPALSLGPLLDTDPLYRTPWRAGRRLVDEHDRPLLGADVEEGAFYTAFPAGARKDQIGAPVVLVRLPPASLELPAGRERWAPEGILAYSKVCTHAGCAIALYRYPLSQPTSKRPALVCPCHYSTFDPARGAAVTFGPAGRPLPQLPLRIDARGALRAAGDFSGPVGPGWRGT